MNLRKSFHWSTALLALITGISLDSLAVLVPDPALEQIIRDRLGKPAGAITREEMATLTSISAFNHGITDLEGIQYAINLTTLDLRDNPTTNHIPISALHKLQHLILINQGLRQIDFVADLQQLNRLDLFANQITNAAPVENLPLLEHLSLSEIPLAPCPC